MEVLAMIENRVPGVGGDHAAKYETSSMLYLHPNTVNLNRLNDERYQDVGAPDQKKNWMGKEYDGHPCYGLGGIDPRRHASADVGRENTMRLIAFFSKWLEGKCDVPNEDRK